MTVWELISIGEEQFFITRSRLELTGVGISLRCFTVCCGTKHQLIMMKMKRGMSVHVKVTSEPTKVIRRSSSSARPKKEKKSVKEMVEGIKCTQQQQQREVVKKRNEMK